MKRVSILAALLLTVASAAFPQAGGFGPLASGNDVPITTVSGLAALAKKGALAVVTDGTGATDCATGGSSTVVTCQYSGSSWAALGGGGGSGTVTSFSSGNFSPLFTTSVATATSTPALSFVASTAAQNAVLAGPSTGGTGAYSFRALVAADIPTLIPIANIGTSGLSATAPVTISAAGLIACATCNATAAVANPPFDKSATGLGNPTADSTFTQPTASVSGWSLAGTAPASVSTATGTAGSSLLNVTAPAGGADSNATGTGGVGGSPNTCTAGAGGAGTGTNTVGGAGGTCNITTGAGGASAGTGVNSNSGNLNVTIGAVGTGGSGTAGKVGVLAVTDSVHGGFSYYTQGTAPSTANANVPANSIIESAPAAVTAYTILKPGAAPTNNFSAPLYSDASPGVGSFAKMPQTVMLTSQYTNSTTGFTNVTGTNSLAFSLEASTTYQGTCVLYYQAASTGGLNIEFTGPASPTFVTYGLVDPGSNTAIVTAAVATAYSTSLGAVVTTATTNFPATVTFGISNGATPGTLQLLAKSSAAVQLQIQTGSYCVMQ